MKHNLVKKFKALLIALHHEKSTIEARLDEINRALNESPGTTAKISTARVIAKPRKGMSVAGRAKVAAAQRARWAKLKGEANATVKRGTKPKARRKMTAAGRAKIAAAAKARWAKAKAAGKTTL